MILNENHHFWRRKVYEQTIIVEFLNFSLGLILGWMLFLMEDCHRHCKTFNIIPSLYPLDNSRISLPINLVMTTKYLFRLGQMSLGRQSTPG